MTLNSFLRPYCFVIVVAGLALTFPAHAQLANTTALTGTITDSSGASVPDVAVKAVNKATQDTYNAKTNPDGNFTIQFIRIGAYSITATKDGFSSVTQDGIQIDANQTVRTNFTLQIGSVSQNVVVTAGAPSVSTDNAAAKETVSTRAVVELPLNGRNVLSIATSTPGVLPGLKPANGNPPGEGYIAAGTREIQNVVTLDGVSIMNNLIMTTPYHPSPDAVQEMEVQTGTYTAQYGGYMGAHLNVISKSGGNDLHGAVFEFLRNDKLNARNYFANPAQPKPTVRQNQFGLVVNGPVMIPKVYDGRNRTFFMFDYEGLRGNS
ncbi:MAG TPA: carboxypeptidase regulatory-like domain-containing protein, partial [Bryobacteraceae bacterium]|nr:carboxypeptidase regulatory-like domain-containing protein [Bryobacteraceae bacterium]